MNKAFCPYCNGEIPQGMRFCPHCMTSLQKLTTLETPPKHKRRYIVFIILVACIALAAGSILYYAVNKERVEIPQNNSSISSYAEKNSLPETQAKLTKESFINAINNYCMDNDTYYFGIEKSSKISLDDSNGLSIEMTDKSGAVIFINADTELKECEIVIRISHIDPTKNREHFDEIAKAVVLILFDLELDKTYGSFVIDGYSFNINSYDIAELRYSEYYIDVEKSL